MPENATRARTTRRVRRESYRQQHERPGRLPPPLVVVRHAAKNQRTLGVDPKDLEAITTPRFRGDDVADTEVLPLRVNLSRTRFTTVVERIDCVEATTVTSHLHEPRP